VGQVTLVLRSYQTHAVDAVYQACHRHRGVLLVAPTGSGKTVMGSALASRARGKVLVLAHRKELVDQATRRIPGAVVMSIQAAIRRSAVPGVTLVIVDEAHHASAESYRKVLALYPDARVIGLTATPWRTDRRGLGDLFEHVVVAAKPADLIASGDLCPYQAFAYEAPDVSGVAVARGDFAAGELGLAANTAKLRGAVVREYIKHARGHRALLFAVNVEHSLAMVRELRTAGVPAEHIDWQTPGEERERILKGLANGSVDVVSNVQILTEGFDCPAVEVVIVARPTQSLTLHLQMIGRALRPSPGKRSALIHDHAGNMVRHGFPDDERSYELDRTPDYVWRHHTCPFCSVVFSRLKAGNCPSCGVGLAAHVEATLLKRRRKMIAEEAQRLDAERIREARVAAAAQASESTKQKALARWRAEAAEKNYKPGWVAVRFKTVFGTWPPKQRAS
jgi:DNA repair protein RadD